MNAAGTDAGLSLALVGLALLALLLAVVAALGWLRASARAGSAALEQGRLEAQLTAFGLRLKDMQDAAARANERLEREIRTEIGETARAARAESGATLGQLQQSLQQQAQHARDEQGSALKRFGDTLNQQLAQLAQGNDLRFAEVRATLEQKLKDIEANNSLKLDEMRRTVDEKLHATLELRLGESFKLVSERLEQVHRGLGEMQTLAAGVGDLKKVLTNVKTRGTWGEVQLESLLEQILTPDQYEKNVATVPRSNERVEFAIRLPGRQLGGESTPVWLPIDAKFPREDYERLIEAQERADLIGVEEASRALDVRVRREARTIAEKYIAPPHTTDFALLFLPTEGLYAEVLRRPGLSDSLQRDFRITIAGPTTLTALLNSLQMGFRTLAIEQRSSEVWKVLGAVKTEFEKFGGVLAKTRSHLETAARSIDMAEQRTRVMSKALRTVEALPGEQATARLGVALEDELVAPVDPDAQP